MNTKRTVTIGDRCVGDSSHCFLIAEIGINHNGSLDMVMSLIDEAKSAGFDAVKFQKRTVPVVYSREELLKPRVFDRSFIDHALARQNLEGVEYEVLPEASVRRLSQDSTNTVNGDLKYALELGLKEYDLIDDFCRQLDMLWFASCWDGLSVHFINGFDVPCHKIASACLTHADLLRRCRRKGKPIILSTGGSTLDQIRKAVDILGTEDLVLLHCTANYPCPDEKINLNVMRTLRDTFPGVPVGYSGHERDLLPSLLAIEMGACVVERHITLDRTLPGSDQGASIEPSEMDQLSDFAYFSEDRKAYLQKPEHQDRISVILGDGEKRVYPSEQSVMLKLRRVNDF